jgi:hypothetical protein
MGMYAHIRTKNEIEYGGRIGDSGKIIELHNNLYELKDKTNIDFISYVADDYSKLELIYSEFIEAYNKVKNHVQDIQELYQEAFNQPTCMEQDLIVIDYF